MKPVFRYEFTIATAFGWVPFFILKITLQAFYHANIGYLRNWQTFTLACGIGSTIVCTIDACYNYLWTNTFGFFPPKPFGGYTVGSISVFAMYAAVWFRIPKIARKEKELKKRFVIFLVSRFHDLLTAWIYVYFTLLFIVIPSDYQPILGFVCPILREIFMKTLNFFTCRSGGGKNVKMGKFFLNQFRSYLQGWLNFHSRVKLSS